MNAVTDDPPGGFFRNFDIDDGVILIHGGFYGEKI
jgi:hypothetical protein